MGDADPAAGLAALQARVLAFDRARGWDRVRHEHTALYALEELGEVTRELLALAAYKGETAGAPQRLEAELADLLLLLAKLANGLGLDLGRGVAAKLEENERRFPAEGGLDAIARYDAANPRPDRP